MKISNNKTLEFDVNSQDEFGNTSLMKVIRHGNKNMFNCVMALSPNLNVTNNYGHSLIHAVMNYKLDMMKDLIEKKVDLDIAVERNGMTALIVAARYNSPEYIDALRDAGANLDIQDKKGKTAIMYLAPFKGEKFIESFEGLLKKGADISLKDNEGKTVFDYAKENPIALVILDVYSKKPNQIIVERLIKEKQR